MGKGRSPATGPTVRLCWTEKKNLCPPLSIALREMWEAGRKGWGVGGGTGQTGCEHHHPSSSPFYLPLSPTDRHYLNVKLFSYHTHAA